jgi:hypothetical protein
MSGPVLGIERTADIVLDRTRLTQSGRSIDAMTSVGRAPHQARSVDSVQGFGKISTAGSTLSSHIDKVRRSRVGPAGAGRRGP